MRTTTPQDSTRAELQQVGGSRLTAAIYDPFLWLGERLGMARRRADLLSGARGRVLEIGAGTGLNLAHYPTGLDELVVTEPAQTMSRRLDKRAASAAAPLTQVSARAEDLPFDDDSFDTVVSTLVLCTVADPERAVAEILRVLRPGGRLLFCEHVRAEPGWRRNLQRSAATGWAAFADGCRCDRPTLELIRERFRTVEARTGSWRGMPAIVRPIVWGTAAA
jgi:SAM-dependent methyltransferase